MVTGPSVKWFESQLLYMGQSRQAFVNSSHWWHPSTSVGLIHTLWLRIPKLKKGDKDIYKIETLFSIETGNTFTFL